MTVLKERIRTTVQPRRDEHMECQAILDEVGISFSKFCEMCARALRIAVERSGAKTPEEIKAVIDNLFGD